MSAEPPTELRGEALVEWSVAYENETGYDSIPTIERVYEQTDGGAFVCVWPRCNVVRRDAAALWRHVHFSPAHRPAI